MRKPFYGRHATAILAVAVFMLPVVLLGAARAMRSNNNDVRKWLPEGFPATQEYNWFQERFGNEEFILASWEGCTLEDSRLEMLATKLLGSPSATYQDAPLFNSVTTGPRLLKRLMAEPVSLSCAEGLKRLQGLLVGPDETQTCAVITLSPEGKKNLKQSLAAIHEVAVRQCAVPRDELRLGGPPVMNRAIDTEGARSLSRLAGLAALSGLVIAWWCFRNLKLTAIVFITGIYAAGVALSVVFFAGSMMNAILLMMPPLVYVAATSGAIHLSNYHREALSEAGPEGAPGQAIAHGWLPLVLATSTTAIGLLSLCYSDLVPVRQFGIYSAVGVVLSLLLLMFLLPAMLQLWPLGERAAHRAAEPLADAAAARWRWAGHGVINRQGWLAIGCLAILVAGGYGVAQLKTSVKIEKFFARDTEIIRNYVWLEDRLGPLVPMEVVIRMDKAAPLNMLERMELIQRLQQSVKNLEAVGPSLSAVTFAPSLEPGGGGREWLRRDILNKRLEESAGKFVDSGYLRSEGSEELWRISLRVKALNNLDYNHFVQSIRDIVEPALTATGSPGLSAVYTGMVPLVYTAQRSLLEGILFGFGTDIFLIVVVIMIFMRHWSAGAILALTAVFPAAIAFGVMGWTGVIADVGTVMTPGVALGVTVDDIVHFLLWFKRGITQGLDRRQAIMLAYRGCARAMFQSWGVLGLGLSMFALSDFVPTQRFGLLMVSLLTAGLIGNLIFMPALLAGPLGAIFARRIKARSAGHDSGHGQTPEKEPSSSVPKPKGARTVGAAVHSSL